jgi:hypothetical protein
MAKTKTATTDLRIKLTPIQARALTATAPFVDLEGGIRAAKSTAANIKKHRLVTEYPGIHLLHARWTDEDTMGELVPKWRDFARQVGLQLRWHPDEQYDEVLGTTGPSGHNSRVYVRGLRSSESANPYKAIRGLDLAWFHVEQAEELPAGYWAELVGRLSQIGYPHGGWLTPQPVNYKHWIDDEFPEDNHIPGHLYLRTNCYDNIANVGRDYIAQLEAEYPLGSAKRRTLLEGRRGLATPGEPVYAGYFRRELHLDPTLRMHPSSPLLEGWDFGHTAPCVTWWQWLPIGRFQFLGAVMGSDMYLEDFAPIALRYRGEWCRDPMEVWSVGDPAGLDVSNQGTVTTKVRDILAMHGVHPISQSHANRPEVRYQAIQTIGGLMRRLALDGRPSLLCVPDRQVIVSQDGAKETPFLTDGFEAGYVWDTRQLVGVSAQIRRPKKDGTYDHSQNATEYIALAFGGEAQPTQADVAKIARREQRRAQVDYDPDDPPRGRRRVTVGISGRGGY